MKTNETLQKDIQNAIAREPLLHATEISVTAKDGVVSLTGTVDSYLKKLEAETATKKVAGVQAVVENIEVKLSSAWNQTNEEIAHAVLSAFKTSLLVPDDKVKIEIEDGWITLSGTMPWYYQKVAIHDAVKYIPGIKGVTNNIVIKSEMEDKLDKEDIEMALARSWWVNSTEIVVEVRDREVTLSGSVASYFQTEEAEAIAWKTPGIWSVNNRLQINWN